MLGRKPTLTTHVPRASGIPPCGLKKRADTRLHLPGADALQALLHEHAGLQAKTIFGELQRRYPGRFADGQLRTRNLPS